MEFSVEYWLERRIVRFGAKNLRKVNFSWHCGNFPFLSATIVPCCSTCCSKPSRIPCSRNLAWNVDLGTELCRICPIWCRKWQKSQLSMALGNFPFLRVQNFHSWVWNFHFLSVEFPFSERRILASLFRALLQFLHAKFAFSEHRIRFLNPAHALHGTEFLTLRLSVCLCLCVCVCVCGQNISKLINQSTSFSVGAFPVTQGGSTRFWKKIAPG